MKLVWVNVKDLYKECGYPLRENAVAQSDCCRRPAMSVVTGPNGCFYYRCAKHEGYYAPKVRGKHSRRVKVLEAHLP